MKHRNQFAALAKKFNSRKPVTITLQLTPRELETLALNAANVYHHEQNTGPDVNDRPLVVEWYCILEALKTALNSLDK